MKQYKTMGIVIKRHNFGEADRMLTIYTHEFGKIKVIAKGVRKTRSKLGGHLELFYISDFVLHKGKNIDIVSAAHMVKRYKNIEDKKLINYFFGIAELVYFATEEREENKAIFNLIDEVLSKIDSSNASVLFCLFELKFYNFLGYHPETSKCAACSFGLKSGEVSFLYRDGGVICLECAKKKKQSMRISDNTYKILRFAKNGSVTNLIKIGYTDEIINELSQVIRQMRYEIIERELKSLN